MRYNLIMDTNMAPLVPKPALITLKVEVKANQNQPFAGWKAKINTVISSQPGFISIEFLSPCVTGKDWLVIQQFGDLQKCADWRSSPVYQGLLSELNRLAVPGSVQEASDGEFSLNHGITEVIVAEVYPERAREYRDWIARIHLFESSYPGFRGVYVKSPVESKGKFWITLLQFDTVQNLDNWLASSERQQLLAESKSMISYFETHRVISPYAGWFASMAKAGEIPALWKQTMIILLVLFPIVMLEFRYLNPWLKGLDISLATFIGNALSVSLISFPGMPIAIYFLGWWLLPRSRHRKLLVAIGTLLMIALYALEVWLLWGFV